MTPKLSCYFGCQIGFGTLGAANQPLDFFQASLNLSLEHKGIDRRVLLLERRALLALKHVALQEPLIRRFGRVVALDLARTLAALFHQLGRRTKVIVIQRPGVAITEC